VKWPRVLPFGESAFLVELGDTFDDTLAALARDVADRWDGGPAIPGYASVVLQFAGSPSAAERRVHELLQSGARASATQVSTHVVEIPIRYDGPDLEDVARMSKLSVEKLIALHSGREYTAYFLGFLPGWAYCGRLDRKIVATRLERPRERVPAGSVGVVDGQTGVYPYQSPGGWRLIGSTDVVMFDPSRERASLIRAGDRIRFVRT